MIIRYEIASFETLEMVAFTQKLAVRHRSTSRITFPHRGDRDIFQ